MTEAQYHAFVKMREKGIQVDSLRQAQEATVDWTSDPCHRCGRWPLSIHNRSGLCRECSRRHVGGRQRSRMRKNQLDSQRRIA